MNSRGSTLKTLLGRLTFSEYTAAMAANRSRTSKGTYRQIRRDTEIGTIEKKYGVDLGVRRDMKLGNYLEKKGYPSLSRLLKDSK